VFGRHAPAGCFDHPGTARIRNQEAVVITEPGFFITAATALAVAFDQLADNILGRFCRVTPFKTESYQVHAQQAVFFKRLARKDRLIADDNTVFVDAGFRSPHPEWAA